MSSSSHQSTFSSLFELPSSVQQDQLSTARSLLDSLTQESHEYNESLQSLTQHLQKIKQSISQQKSKVQKQEKMVGSRMRASNSKKVTLQQKKPPREHFFVWKARVPKMNAHQKEQYFYKQKIPLQFSVNPWKRGDEGLLMQSIRKVNREKMIFDLAHKYMYDTRPGSAIEFRAEMQRLEQLDDSHMEHVSDDFPWDKVANEYNHGKRSAHRTSQECKQRYYNSIMMNTASWSKEEDLTIRKLAKKYNGHHWDKVAKELGTNRSAFDCLSRYQRSLNTKMLKSKWTSDDDEMLRLAVERYGEHNWQEVARHVQGRTGQQCLHRWAKAINPRIEHGKWNLQQDKILFLAVHAYGEGNWAKISKHIHGRTDVQCRERWHNVLNPGVSQKAWTDEEDRRLNQLIKKYKVGNWATIARHLNTGRTDNQCWRRWKALNPEQALDGYTRRLVKGERMLPQNFVGREKDRSTLTVEDVEELTTSDEEDIEKAVRDRRSRRKRRRENSIYGNRIHPFLRDHWKRKVQIDDILQKDPCLQFLESQEIEEMIRYLFMCSSGDAEELHRHHVALAEKKAENAARRVVRASQAPCIIAPHQELSKIVEDDEESRVALYRLCNAIDSCSEGHEEAFDEEHSESQAETLDTELFQHEQVVEFQSRLGGLFQGALLGEMEEFFGSGMNE